MTVLSQADRDLVAQQVTQDISNTFTPTSGTKSDWKILIGALDDYLNTNATSINNSIPQPQRGIFTTVEKARAMKFVITMRYLRGS